MEHKLLRTEAKLNAIPAFEDNYRVEMWLKDFEAAAESFSCCTAPKMLYAKRLLAGSAKMALRSKPDLVKWGVLNEFSESISGANLHRRMMDRKQKKDELCRNIYSLCTNCEQERSSMTRR